jgi:hypothetical protein
MALKAVDAGMRFDRNHRFRIRQRERDRKWPFKRKRVPSKERKGSDVRVLRGLLRGSDPTTPAASKRFSRKVVRGSYPGEAEGCWRWTIIRRRHDPGRPRRAP